MSYTFEMNNERRDINFLSGKIKEQSPVVEIFSAMVQGKDLSSFGKKADVAVKYITELNDKASRGDMYAQSELNEIRRLVIEPALLQEIKLLGIFGNYEQLGWNDSAEVEVTEIIDRGARVQGEGQDVPFPVITKKRVPIATQTVSGGHAVNYRKAALGDMSDENTLQEQVKIQIRNLAAKYVLDTIYKAIKNSTGVKYFSEEAGLTKTNVDKVIAAVRRAGKPTITGDYALVSQLNAFAGFQGTTPAVTGVSQKALEEIHATGLLGMYNGAIVSEMPNPYDYTTLTADGKDYETLLPMGIGYVLPTGAKSPIHTITRGGLTTMTGQDVTTGELLTRFDLQVGAFVEPGKTHEIGIIADKNLGVD